jgi:hypothetical protein
MHIEMHVLRKVYKYICPLIMRSCLWTSILWNQTVKMQDPDGNVVVCTQYVPQ